MAVLETPWFMKTKTSDLGRINKVFDERFQASVAQIEYKKRKSLIKLEEEIKNIKLECRKIRTEVDFSTDLDEHGKQLSEETAKSKATMRHGKKGGRNKYAGANGYSIPPEMEQERQRYLRLIGRNRRREMTMVELRDMCNKCIGKESSDDTNEYIKQARHILFPKKDRVLKRQKKKDQLRVSSRFDEILYNSSQNDEDQDTLERLPKVKDDSDKYKDNEREFSAGGRVSIRSKSASSSGRTRDASNVPSLSRVKSLTVVCNSDIETPRERMVTSVSV